MTPTEPIYRRYGFPTVLTFWLAQMGRSRHWNKNRRPIVDHQ
jgi:hypothetical protein